jgi:hypothetical protein
VYEIKNINFGINYHVVARSMPSESKSRIGEEI